MSKRLAAVFFLFCALFSALNVRLAVLADSSGLRETALDQHGFTLTVRTARGQIYDRNFKKLVNTEEKTVFAVQPRPETAAALLDAAPEKEREALYRSLQGGLPFLTEALPASFRAEGVTPVKTAVRYGEKQPAAHVIGYVDRDGNGTTGIEKAFDARLKEAGGTVRLRYALNGLGEALFADAPEAAESGTPAAGVVLTLDREIQEICETAGEKSIRQGAVVVMEPESGRLLGCASFPSYDPNDVAASLPSGDGPLLNRCFSSFPAGSTFKVVLAAAALEEGIGPGFSHDCAGFIDVGGQLFRCHRLSGHGRLDLEGGLVESCNPYFIALGQRLGAGKITETAAALSFGREEALAEGLFTGAGVLPSAETLRSPAAVANLSFGQGDLMVTPVQLCQMISSVANGGRTPLPRLVEGYTSDGETLEEEIPLSAPIIAMSGGTAGRLREMLRACVEEKEEIRARPSRTTAAGKTGTAQTGRFDEDGNELYDAWFVGCFPADAPRYAVSVIAENGGSGNLTAGPVFAEIADRITLLDETRAGRAVR